MNRDERIVVVGGGLTGLRAAERLRELKFEGEITILGDEKLPPYHRPALSKQLLQGTLRPSDLTLPAYEDLNARWRFGTQVRQLIPNKKTLVLPGGEEMTYDGLIIATGVEARKQNGVPYHDPRVLVLRTMADGLDMERIIGNSKGRVAVVGGGFTGCELAASLTHLSREVTLIGRGKNLLGNVLGDELGEWLTGVHRDHGVDLALGNSIEEWNPTPEGIGLKLTDGSTLMVSCVILAAGTVPMTHWLRGSGLPLDNGVVCEPTCHVVGAEDVVAAGDVAQWPNLRFDNVPRRVEHWLNAVEMGRASAESLLAGRAAAEPFSPMPRFWTDQYGYRIQAAGMIKLGKDIVKLGTPDEGTGTVYGYSLEGRLMAVAGVDCPSAMISWAESVSRQNPAPRPRVPAEETKTPVTVGGPKKKGSGKHQLPPKDKQFQREERREPEIGFVDQPPRPAEVSGPIPPRPAEVSGPIAVGAGRGVPGRPQNVVDSFSRMLPVAVRPPGAGAPPPGARPPVGPPPLNGRPPVAPQQSGPHARPVNGRPPVALQDSGPHARPVNGRPPVALQDSGPHARPVNGRPPVPAQPSGPLARPVNGGPGPRGPINAPFGDGASSGAFANGSTSGAFVNGSPVNGSNGNGSPVNGSNGHAAAGLGSPFGGSPGRNGSPRGDVSRNGVPTDPFKAPTNGSPQLGPATNRIPAQGPSAPPPPPALPEFSAAEMTDVRNGFPPPLSGRLAPGEGVAIDVTGQMALLDANGHVRTPQFSDPARDSAFEPPAPRRGPADSFDMPAVRGPESSFAGMPPARPGPESSSSGMPPARRGPADSFDMPAVRGPESSFAGMPPARRGPEASSSGMPPARRGPEASSSGMPPARRGPDSSFSSMPPARRRGSESTRMPAVRGPESSHDSMAPARRSADSSFGGMPPARRGADNPRRGSDSSFSGMPPARRGGDSPRRGSESSFSGMPPARRDAEDSYRALPPASRSADDYEPPSRRASGDSFSDLPPASRRGSSTSSRMIPARGSADDSFSTSITETSRRAAHRAEDLTPEFGRPTSSPRRRGADREASVASALSSMDDALDRIPARMPKHGRPEDYGHLLPSARGGPEDSYDQMSPVERPARAAGGRRRARA
jgi:NADPH-dependent 2,4-dienoyl-CoA reductase/sulfur reductase-like enzyme